MRVEHVGPDTQLGIVIDAANHPHAVPHVLGEQFASGAAFPVARLAPVGDADLIMREKVRRGFEQFFHAAHLLLQHLKDCRDLPGSR